MVHSPLKTGLSLQIVMGDSDANWPYDTSKKKSGIPHRIMKSRYGIRNTAVGGARTNSQQTGKLRGCFGPMVSFYLLIVDRVIVIF